MSMIMIMMEDGLDDHSQISFLGGGGYSFVYCNKL